MALKDLKEYLKSRNAKRKCPSFSQKSDPIPVGVRELADVCQKMKDDNEKRHKIRCQEHV